MALSGLIIFISIKQHQGVHTHRAVQSILKRPDLEKALGGQCLKTLQIHRCSLFQTRIHRGSILLQP